ncbi:hypothetical protein JOM56_001986 [Amanita muscaria]
MHALSHSLAHRATPTTRTRVRWQPYSPTSKSSMTTSLPSPSSSLFNSPNSEETSPPSLSSSRELNRPPSKPFSHPTKEVSPRELSKNKFALGLVDQAVGSLSEIWKPQDIPTLFLTGPKATITLDCSKGQKSLVCPSKPFIQHPNTSPPSAKEIQSSSFKNRLVPIKGFVHEVLRRSRTSAHVLQTALCYIEALRPMVPEFIRKERAGESWKEPASADLIEVLADAELQQHAEVQLPLGSTLTDRSDFVARPPSTPRMTDESCKQGCASGMPAAVASELARSDTLPPVELPSPLLCPRRSFLAALILASKFTQDKCYSNRAWAKLSGLTPREISRCERALGEVLEWRLWVGKLPVATQATPRALHRSQSESCLKSRPSEPFLLQDEHGRSSATTDRSLRRCSTLPAEAFAPKQKADGYPISDITMSDSQAAPLDTTSAVPLQWPASFTCHIAAEDSPDSESSTPPLVYSPTTSDSSGSERTTQASSFQEVPENVLAQIHSVLSDHISLSLQTPGVVIKGASGMQDFVVTAPSVFLPATIEEGIRSAWTLEESTFVSLN